MSRWNLGWLLGITAAALVGLSLTYSAPPHATGTLQKKHENLRLLVDVLEEVQSRYVKDLDSDKMRDLVENMINDGLERHLDPHSSFINPDEFRQFQRQSKGRFGGVGIRIGLHPRTGQLYVESPMMGTPAYEAGVMAGDHILKIDGKTTENISLKKAMEVIQGEPGTKVTLTVLHEGAKKALDLDIVRAEITIDSVVGDQRLANNLKEWDFWIDPVSKIGYIRLVQFTETTMADLVHVVDSLQKQNMRGLILDLRNNPGGLLRAAVEASSLFLPEGKRIVSTKGRNQKEEVYESHPPQGFPQGSYAIAILINRYSASASEILAAALQDHLRAIIIGERSFGKGSVQNVIPMENGLSALKLTTASYWRPSGKNIHRFAESKDGDDWGVQPNDSGYRLTKQSLAALEAAAVPKDVTAKLHSLLGKRFSTEKDYVDAVEKVASAEDLKNYRTKFLEHADHGFEVRLSDIERMHYFRWRARRDVVRRPGEALPKPVSEEEALPADFRDRVLDKAVEYLREQIKKGVQQGALPQPRLIPPQGNPVVDTTATAPRFSICSSC